MTILKIFEPGVSAGAWHSLAKDYTAIAEDAVLFKKSTGEKLRDDQAKEFVDKLVAELEYYGYEQ